MSVMCVSCADFLVESDNRTVILVKPPAQPWPTCHFFHLTMFMLCFFFPSSSPSAHRRWGVKERSFLQNWAESPSFPNSFLPSFLLRNHTSFLTVHLSVFFLFILSFFLSFTLKENLYCWTGKIDMTLKAFSHIHASDMLFKFLWKLVWFVLKIANIIIQILEPRHIKQNIRVYSIPGCQIYSIHLL